VFVFFIISFVIFLAFAQCFFMAYYASVDGYQSYQASIMSVLRFTVLDFDYQALSAVRSASGCACRACTSTSRRSLRCAQHPAVHVVHALSLPGALCGALSIEKRTCPL
jgi:hypothetical protein